MRTHPTYLQDKGQDDNGPQYPPFEEGHEYGTTVDNEGNLVPFETVIQGDDRHPEVNVPIEPVKPDDEEN